MSTPNDGGPAFPVLEMHTDGRARTTQGGMTMRDYFAAKALQGVLADANSTCTAELLARDAYKIADAMLAARKANT